MLKLELTTVGGRKIYPIGLVDSGADLTLVNIQYAKELGLDIAKLKEKSMRGIGEGTITTFLATFPIKPVEFEKDHDVFELIEVKK